MTGLKDMVAKAMKNPSNTRPKPVLVSTDARRALTEKVREWSGWSDARLVIGKPKSVSPFATCDHNKREFTFNVDALALNPNRVLLNVTPFRLKQEAILTGTMLHEAGHARYSLWKPRTKEDAATWVHADGKAITKAEVHLATLMEEARIEGLIARDAKKIGADGLDWTMRAMAAHLMPMTDLSMDPNTAIMQLIESWALRAGRQIALSAHNVGYRAPHWVDDFNVMLEQALMDHTHQSTGGGRSAGASASYLLREMVKWDGTTGLYPITHARQVLELLFPETDPDDMPEAQAGCADPDPEGEEEPEDQPGGDETGDEPEEGDEDQSDDTEPGDGDSEGEGDDSDPEGEAEEDSEDGDGASDSTDGEPEQVDTDSDLAKQLRDMETNADEEVEDETDDVSTNRSGSTPEKDADGFRGPTAEERETQRHAERFLRTVIAPSETSKVSLSESPCASVDPVALSKWKAGGKTTAPTFFKRTRREVQPSPPVKIAVLVDVSYSMSPLQQPSALLSWAMSAAAVDLQNFAGRGQQIESTLIHWGDRARVVKPNGKPIPGLKMAPCNEFTTAMYAALTLVEDEIPGFFDVSDKPENRLLVHFTDWELDEYMMPQITARISSALHAGVNMLTIAPEGYSDNPHFGSELPNILSKIPSGYPGRVTTLPFDPKRPEKVWQEALTALGQ